jgi:predicted nucleic acid-binding Zn finger protein
MSEFWQRPGEKKELDDALRREIEEEFGTRGRKALAAIDAGRVKKYLDFFVVMGSTGEYVVAEDICTCRDFTFRNRECWHLLAVRIAEATGTFVCIDAWYQEKWKK